MAEVDLRHYKPPSGFKACVRGILQAVSAKWELRGPLRPYCHGSIVVGQVIPNLVTTAWMIAIPAAAGIHYYVGPLLGTKPLHHDLLGISAVLQLVLILVLVLFVALRNPGLIQKGHGLPEGLLPEDLDVQGWPRARSICVRNVWVRQEFCRTCMLWRPLRSKHLRDSGWCVEGFDHYCQLLGTVVGRRNYLAFIALVHFLALFTLEALVVLGVGVLPHRRRASRGGHWLETLLDSPDICCAFAYALLWLCFALRILHLHWFLIARNMTMNEYVKSHWGLGNDPQRGEVPGSYANQNPFDKGCTSNFFDVCVSGVAAA
ncbi:unnamed protein product [Polarella glacialis]|uniref:Palmitoyltransferase n=1 Tax=Polarella glacialis TaxID=89957 RepID=A0A813DB24_POLGL|nr:unnamed protein product [Polarella glacialis]CAE8710785.1 unnamed protein product [Polarella glacialis]